MNVTSIARKAARRPQGARQATTASKAVCLALGALADAIPALNRLLSERLPVKASYHVAKLAKLANAELEIFEAQRRKLIEEYGAERELTAEETAKGMTGPVREVTPANLQAFLAALADLRTTDVTLAFGPLPYADLPAQMTGEDLMALGALVGEP